MRDKDAAYRPIRQPETAGDEEADTAEESTQFIRSSASSDITVTEGEAKQAKKGSTGRDPSPRWWHLLPLASSTTSSSSRERRGWFVTSTLLAILGATNLLSLAFGAFAGRHSAYSNNNLDRECAAHTAQYSPLISNVDIHYADVKFNGSFLQENVYRRPGAPEVDAAWEALGVDYRAGVIPTEEGLRSGLTPGHVQRADKYGGGFLVNVEGMHHLHCLNLVRKSLYYNFDYYKQLGTHAFMNDDHILQLHVSHCLDILRQVLMCNFDTGVLGQVWYNPEQLAAFPDFHTTHKCKNYEAIRKWSHDLQAPEDVPPDYLKEADPEYVWPSTP